MAAKLPSGLRAPRRPQTVMRPDRPQLFIIFHAPLRISQTPRRQGFLNRPRNVAAGRGIPRLYFSQRQQYFEGDITANGAAWSAISRSGSENEVP